MHKTYSEMLLDIRSTINKMADDQLLDMMDLATLAEWLLGPIRCRQCHRLINSGTICPHEADITLSSFSRYEEGVSLNQSCPINTKLPQIMNYIGG